MLDTDEIEIKGEDCTISGDDGEMFAISPEGIKSSFYENEFPDHVNVYNDLFKENNRSIFIS
jgi:hypothetical protein